MEHDGKGPSVTEETVEGCEDCSFYAEKFNLSLFKHIEFEAKSLVGRLLFPRNTSVRSEYANLGCGRFYLQGFINVDFYSFRHRVADLSLDLRRGLPFPSNVFKGIFSEHTLEHLYPLEALRLLKECKRVLKPGGVIRLVVPDLEKYVRHYMGAPSHPQFEKCFSNGCEAIRGISQNWGHLSLWDGKMLSSALLSAGFQNVEARLYRKGRDNMLLADLEVRQWESLYMEAVKPDADAPLA